ncbi:hypothetical protein BBJ28_00021992 [Nothophytophthora sp. Chile5]|nr:hypothetical protein BBJ28_00021992 [Nothophytophthora sp. Chile5]
MAVPLINGEPVDGATRAGIPSSQSTQGVGDDQPQEAMKTTAQRHMTRRLLETATMPSPRDPFMFANGWLMAYVNVGDVVFFAQTDARTVIGVTTTEISIDQGLQHPLGGGESIEVRKRVFSTSEDTTLQGAMNSRGFHLHSHDDTVNSASPHKSLQVRHFADASTTMARLLPGNVSVENGSDVVLTLLDLSENLTGSTFVRLAGGSYLVDPTRPATATQFFLDRPFAGPTYDDLPIFVDGIGTGILLEVVGSAGVGASASIDAVATQAGETNSTSLIVSTTAAGVSAGRVKIDHSGIQFLGEATSISSEVDSISIQPAKELLLNAGSQDNKPGSTVFVRSGASNWQQGGDIDMETGTSNNGTASGRVILRTSDGIAANASSGSVEIGSGEGQAGSSGAINLYSGDAHAGESGSIHISTGSASGPKSGDILLESSTSTGGNGGIIQLSVGKGGAQGGGYLAVMFKLEAAAFLVELVELVEMCSYKVHLLGLLEPVDLWCSLLARLSTVTQVESIC